MIDWCRRWYRRIRGLKWLSPGSFVLCAVTIAAVFLAAHLAGWRAKTGVFSGTLAAEQNAQIIQGFQALIYTSFYLGAVVVSPILVIAAAVFQAMAVWERRRLGRASTGGAALKA